VRLNLGCGNDVKSGYVNVDFRDMHGVEKVDLSIIPWPWADSTADEILMLDFLEHFPYRKTDYLLMEAWRVLKIGGKLVVQVPDLEHCARAASFLAPFLCNQCGYEFFVPFEENGVIKETPKTCNSCGRPWHLIAESATRRLYGGQNYEGNWHFNAFSKIQLTNILLSLGFSDIMDLEKMHQRINWNFKLSATKISNAWGDQ